MSNSGRQITINVRSPKFYFDPTVYVRPGLQIQQVLDIKYSFDLFDTDRSGAIDCRELKATMTSLGFQALNGAVFQMICDLDQDGNGEIDFQEWIGLMTKQGSNRNSRGHYDKIFALFDDERTGYISIKNLRRVALELGEDISEEELNGMILRADLDNDELVGHEEFYTIMTRPIRR